MDIRYEFSEEDAKRFAHSVGAKTKHNFNELNFLYCPLCHGGANKDKWTFSISLADGRCTCQRSSCGYRGNMITLARDFGFSLNDDVNRYYNINDYNSRFKTFKNPKKKIDVRNGAIDYLVKRKIAADVVQKFEITTKPDNDSILVFPFKDENGELKFVKYRNMDFKKGESFGSKEWSEPNCMPILFGMNHCNPSNGTLIITEGQIDSLSVTSAGYENAISVPLGMNGFTWVAHCWDFVNQFKKLIVFGDLENGRISLLDGLRKKFKALSIYHVQIDDYLDCKDANEILIKYGAEQIRKCIDNAVPVKITNTIDLADVAERNPYDMAKVKTGLKDLDQLLCGGIPFGGVTLITGKPGEGKSTLASQIIANAIEQNYKCFVYSGELPNFLFKSWLDYQIAGSDYIFGYQNDIYGYVHYRIKDDAQQKINDWYRNKVTLYDNDALSDLEEQTALLEIIEKSVLQNDIKVVLIDNLMTALTDDFKSSDKYDRQSRFMRDLAELARRNNICVLLVAHKRKNNFSTNENDEVSGSADIVNLAMVTLSYQKNKDLDPNSRYLKVSKNRLFGRVSTGHGWEMKFDSVSKRIAGVNDKNEKHYSWEKFGDFTEVVPNDIPF